jgi:hypothetical protein
MGELTVPKQRIEVAVQLAGGLERRVSLFLAEGAPGHAGQERIGDLLEVDGEFIPAVDAAAEGMTFLRCAAILVVAAPSGPALGAADDVTLPTEHEVDVALDDGRVLHGVLSYALPTDRSRLVDYLNQPARFLPLLRDGEVLFVNKNHVTRISALER